MKHHVKESKDDINNTGLQREANMAAEDTISTSTENDNITMNDITAEKKEKTEILQRIMKTIALLVTQHLKNRGNSIQTRI